MTTVSYLLLRRVRALVIAGGTGFIVGLPTFRPSYLNSHILSRVGSSKLAMDLTPQLSVIPVFMLVVFLLTVAVVVTHLRSVRSNEQLLVLCVVALGYLSISIGGSVLDNRLFQNTAAWMAVPVATATVAAIATLHVSPWLPSNRTDRLRVLVVGMALIGGFSLYLPHLLPPIVR